MYDWVMMQIMKIADEFFFWEWHAIVREVNWGNAKRERRLVRILSNWTDYIAVITD